MNSRNIYSRSVAELKIEEPYLSKIASAMLQEVLISLSEIHGIPIYWTRNGLRFDLEVLGFIDPNCPLKMASSTRS